MTILKQHISADGYECRQVQPDGGGRYRWEVHYQGQWRTLRELSEMIPNNSPNGLNWRMNQKGTVIPNNDRLLRGMPIALWGKRKDGTLYCKTAIPSKWAGEWAAMKGIPNTMEMRGAFIRHLSAEVGKQPEDPTGALKRTLRAFQWQPEEATA